MIQKTTAAPAPQSTAEAMALQPFALSFEQYRAAGWLGILPLPYRHKKNPPEGFTGKRGGWPTAADDARWVARWSRSNICLRMPQGVIGIDVDHYMKHGVFKRGADQLATLVEAFGELPATWSSTRRAPDSPARIYFYRVPEGLEFETKPADDIEVIQFSHRYAVVWPSVVPDDDVPGVIWQYAWYGPNRAVADRVPSPEELAELPRSWVDALRKQPGGSAVRGSGGARLGGGTGFEELRALPPDHPGRGNDWLTRLAGHLARRHTDRAAYIEELRSIDNESIHPHPEDRFMATATSVWNTELEGQAEDAAVLAALVERSNQKLEQQKAAQTSAESSGRYEQTHVGEARRLRDWYGPDLRYVIGRGWLGWDGRRWAENNSKVYQAVHAMTDRMLADAKKVRDDESRKKALDYVRSLQFSANINGVISQAKHLDALQVPGTVFDADPYKLLVGNGVVDLRTGELLANRQDFMITKGSTVDYDPKAECPRWEAFLKWAFSGSAELVDYVQRMVGEIMIGNNDGQHGYFLYGPGGNGKTQLIEVIGGLLGEYFAISEADLLTAKEAASHTESEASLAGSRMVAISETRRGQVLDESRFNRLSGEKVLRASRKGEKSFEFPVTFTMVLYGNVRPTIPFTDGVRRRVKVIKMSAKVTDAERVDDLSGLLLREEGPAIMAWAVKGAMRVAAGEKVADPPIVTAAVKEWQQENNPFGEFAEDYLEVDPAGKMSNDYLWGLYEIYRRNGGRDIAKDITTLGKRLMEWVSIEDLQGVQRGTMKVDGKLKRGFKGITDKRNGPM